MRVWRLVRRGHEALDGEGARLAGGRWTSPGVPVVYTSAHLSLAVLELLVHVRPERIPDDLLMLEIELPDDLATHALADDRLPHDWRAHPPPSTTQRLGDAWALERAAVVLSVPSSVLPSERNLLLNPLHPDAGRWQVARLERFELDPRLFQVRSFRSPRAGS